jgi:hypothetical protein
LRAHRDYKDFSKSLGQVSRQGKGSPQKNFGARHQSSAVAMFDERVCLILSNVTSGLPFVCRFEDATACKSKQKNSSYQQRGRIGKCKTMNESATIANSQQQYGSPLLTGELYVRILPDEPFYFCKYHYII